MKNLLTAVCAATLMFTACNTAPADKKAETTAAAPTAAAPAAPAAAAPTATTCYAYYLKKDVSAVQITTDGDKVSGYMDWSPFEKDGGHGFLIGTKSGNMITADWTVMIEGSKNIEQVVFKIDGDKLLRAEGELVEKGDKLVLKDVAKAKYTDVYNKVDCEKVAKNIGFAKDAETALKKM
jgi:hypothetical protein